MKRKTLVIGIVTAFFACNLFAAYDPAVDPLAPGVELISVSNLLTGLSFEGQIDYDVYAPGEFTGDIAVATDALLPASAFSDQYVYQYQITSTQGYGENLSIAFDSGSGSTNFGYSSNPGSDVAPHMVFDAATLVSYSFAIVAGQSTASLLFTSPYGPTAGNAMVHGMMAGSQAVVVPVPVPEPITLILLGAGCLPLRYYRKRSR